MRTFSTPESALKGEITKLGIIECALAVAVYVAIALRLHTFRHFYLAIALAPLTLLRTEESTAWTLRAYLNAVQVDDSNFNPAFRTVFAIGPVPVRGVLVVLFALVYAQFFVPLSCSVLRVAGMAYGFARRPLRTIAEMPRNWVRQALCTDFAHPPESIPGELTHDDHFITFSGMWSAIAAMWPAIRRMWPAAKHEPVTRVVGIRTEVFQVILGILILPIAVLLFLPPLLYRISFKATCVCYLPFLWVAQYTTGTKMPLKFRLERLTKGELEKARRWLAGFVLGVAGVVAALHLGILDLTSVTSKFPVEFAAVNVFGAMKSFRWWHATLLIDALLTFFLFYFSDAAPARMDTQVRGEALVANTISMTSFLRGAVAVGTMTRFCWVAILNVVPASVRGFLSVL